LAIAFSNIRHLSMVMNNPNKEVHFRGKLAKRAFSIIPPPPPQKKRTIRTAMREPVHRNKRMINNYLQC